MANESGEIKSSRDTRHSVHCKHPGRWTGQQNPASLKKAGRPTGTEASAGPVLVQVL